MRRSKTPSVGRRDFLKSTAGAVAGTATLASVPVVARGGVETPRPPAGVSAATQAAEAGTPPELDRLTTGRSGSDSIVDVVKALGFEYLASNPGSSFRGIHESLINYGGNRQPEFLTCCHEESSVAMAHGYAKIAGKPMAVLAHGTVGLQHAAMAVYNAYCDRVPIYIILGNSLDATERRPGVEWMHSVQDAAAMVRDYVKWDDLPMSLGHFAESAVRAYKIAMTPPMGPVMIVADTALQENPIADDSRVRVPKLTLTSPPQGDPGAVAELAKMLVAAEMPVLVADRLARTPAGLASLVELAETLQAAVVDQRGRMNFPSRHRLNQSERSRAVISQADLIVGLEVNDLWGTVNSFTDQLHRSARSVIKPGTRLVSLTTQDLFTKANYQDFQRFTEVDLAIGGDAEATLPALIEQVKRLVTGDRQRVFEQRGATLAEAQQVTRDQIREEAAYAWNASPISTPRLAAEVWALIKDEDWSLVDGRLSGWPARLFNFDKHYQHIGGSGGAGIGYGAPASAGAALANRQHGRLSVTFQNDGDLMYGPGVLWTTAHHKIPLLSIMNNNRAYHQEVMHIQRMATRHNRGIDKQKVGTTLENPNIDFTKVAQGLGLYAEGPITNPADLAPALKRAIAVVKKGEPALVDVVMQPR